MIEYANVCLMRREGNQVVIYFSRPSATRIQSRRMVFGISSYKKLGEDGVKTEAITLELITMTANLKPENAFPEIGRIAERIESALKS